MKKKQIKYFLIFLILIVFGLQLKKINFSSDFTTYKDFVPNYSVKKFPLPILYYSNIFPDDIKNKYDYFKKNNFSGFIITALPSNWNDDSRELKRYFADCRYINGLFNFNFLKTSIAENGLPLWQDQEAWASINVKIGKISKFAKESGFRGIVLDTKAYNPRVWNPAYDYEQYNSISEELAKKVIYQRAREVMIEIKENFPEAEIIITPAGLFAKSKEDIYFNNYSYWIHFFNGLLSESDEVKFILIADDLESCTNKNEFASFMVSSNISLKEELDYPDKWEKRQALSFQIWPMGTNSGEKIPRFSAEQVASQIFLAQKYSNNFVVIFDPANTWGENPAIGEYENILKKLKDPLLQGYFFEIQSKKRISYLQFYLNRIFAILKT